MKGCPTDTFLLNAEGYKMEKEIYKDTTRSFEERAADLVSRMTLEEKVSQIGYKAAAIPRLGVSEYNYWREALHGVARQGKATSFPSPLSMSNTWNRELVYRMAEITSTEARGKNSKTNLSYWSPTINLARDPRWGRNEETYGEDPYLTGQMGAAFVKGMQGDDERYLKTIATLKHFAANNNELNRRGGCSVMSEFNFRNYYTKVFQNVTEEVMPASVMSSYNATSIYRNGELIFNYKPSAANPYLLTELLRRNWGFDGYVTSDCGAGEDLVTIEAYKKGVLSSDASDAQMVAQAFLAGMDVECFMHGICPSTENGVEAVKEGYMSEEYLETAVYHLFLQRFKTGEFDEGSKYSDITDEVLETSEHIAAAEEAAEEAWVLLKNEDNVLPLSDDVKNIVIVGNHADKVILGDYSGEPEYTVNPVDGLKAELAKTHPNAVLTFLSEINDTKALDAADVIIAYAGTTLIDSRESFDRSSIALSSSQSHVNDITKAYPDKTVVAIQAVGEIDTAPFADNAKAIMWTSYNGQTQGTALARIITGQANPSGKLTTTWYTSKDMENMELANGELQTLDGIEGYYTNYDLQSSGKNPGRTYRYYKGTPLYPFGYGLSYTDFEYSYIQLDKTNVDANGAITVSAQIKNTGNVTGKEAVQVYISHPGSGDGNIPAKQLVEFGKIELEPGEAKRVRFTINIKSLSLFSEQNQKLYIPNGEYTVMIGKNADDCSLTQTFNVTGELLSVLKTVKAMPDGVSVKGRIRENGVEPVTSINSGLSAIMTDEVWVDLTSAKVSYLSSDTDVAVVDAHGVVTSGTKEGAATITAAVTVDGVTKTSSYPVINKLDK